MIRKSELYFQRFSRYYRYLNLSQSRVDSMMADYFAKPTDFNLLYKQYQLYYTKDHHWVRINNQGQFYMGISYYIPLLLKQIVIGQYLIKNKAIKGQLLATLGSQQIDLGMQSPFQIKNLQFNQQLEWDFRWLNLKHQDIWIVKGQTSINSQQLLTPQKYQSLNKIVKWM